MDPLLLTNRAVAFKGVHPLKTGAMIENMVRVYRYLILFLLVTSLVWGGETVGQNRLVFPTPDRPVAPIVSSA